MIRRLLRQRRQRKLANAGWDAMERCWFVPYASELSPTERAGIDELERRGHVLRDEGGLQLHWHRNLQQ